MLKVSLITHYFSIYRTFSFFLNIIGHLIFLIFKTKYLAIVVAILVFVWTSLIISIDGNFVVLFINLIFLTIKKKMIISLLVQ